MPVRLTSRPLKAVALAALFLGVTGLPIGVEQRSVNSAPAASHISAVYKLRFAGLTLGKFNLAATLTDGNYSLQGSSRITFLTGILFELSGGTTSSGIVAASGPRPAAFSFNFKTKKAKGHLVMKFSRGGVSQVASQPPLRSVPNAIPVEDAHVRDVLDPLTALFMTGRATAPGRHASVCDRRLPVYDGLYRFDLQLSHKKTVRVVKKGKSGYRGPAVICKVKFIPVAGHMPHASQIAFMSQTEEIEAWLIPLPGEDIYVPYHVSIPTPYGTAQMTSTAFHLETADQRKYALVQ